MALRHYDPFYHGLWSPFRAVDRMVDSFFDDNMQLRVRDNAGQMKIGENGDFSYKVNVTGYKPEELKVDIEEEEIVIKGEHKEQHDHEFVHRQFHHRVKIPEGYEKDSIRCDVDEHGVLFITGQKTASVEAPKRSIPIELKKTTADSKANGAK